MNRRKFLSDTLATVGGSLLGPYAKMIVPIISTSIVTYDMETVDINGNRPLQIYMGDSLISHQVMALYQDHITMQKLANAFGLPREFLGFYDPKKGCISTENPDE